MFHQFQINQTVKINQIIMTLGQVLPAMLKEKVAMRSTSKIWNKIKDKKNKRAIQSNQEPKASFKKTVVQHRLKPVSLKSLHPRKLMKAQVRKITNHHSQAKTKFSRLNCLSRKKSKSSQNLLGLLRAQQLQ